MLMYSRIFTAVLLLAGTPMLAVGEDQGRPFELDLSKMTFRPQDQRTEARLARWNDDPMARLAMAMADDQARMLGGHQPGMGQPRAMVFSVRLQKGLAAALMVSSSASGVDFYQRRMTTIKWPWEKDDEDKPAMPLDEQLSIMLGDRLERR
jgi:hypothetical protein